MVADSFQIFVVWFAHNCGDVINMQISQQCLQKTLSSISGEESVKLLTASLGLIFLNFLFLYFSRVTLRSVWEVQRSVLKHTGSHQSGRRGDTWWRWSTSTWWSSCEAVRAVSPLYHTWTDCTAIGCTL